MITVCRVRVCLLLASLGLAVLVPPAATASNTVEKARARVVPWSGYWWPIREGGILRPLEKYDHIAERNAAAWERQRHPVGPDTPTWFGYCHATAAASVMEKEPSRVRHAPAGGGTVVLGIGDQKGLLDACHTDDTANTYGDRYGDGTGSEDKQDLAPDTLWRLLKLHIQQQGVPLILDVEPGPEVWNYPVYAYEISYAPSGEGDVQAARLSLLMADNGVPPDYRGLKVRRHTYQFTFRLCNGSVVMGSGRWVNHSREDHPDFAWYPYVAGAENPEVQYDQVQRLVGDSTPAAPPTATPPAPPSPPPALPPSPPVTPPSPPPATPPVVQPAAPPAAPPPATPPAPQPAAEPVRPESEPVPISPMELVALIAEKTSSFGLDVTVDRFDGAHYRIGETFFLRCASEKPGYLYLLYVNDQGEPALLYPLAGEDNRVPGQLAVEIPDPKAGFAFPVQGPAGTARVKALVTSRPLALTGVLQAQQGQTRQKAPSRHEGRRLVQPVGFRWHPAQRRQILRILEQYQRQQPLAAGQLAGVDPKQVLGPFAQDEVALYVEDPNRQRKER